MRVLRGRAATPTADRAVTKELLERTADTPALRVWQPHRTVAFGRRDASCEGYDRARRAATERGYVTLERSVGGRAVAFTGSTVAFVRAEPVEEARTGIQARYDRVAEEVAAALDSLGVTVEPGEPDGAFCPGTHSLSASGKLVGIAQRVRSEVALVSGIVVACDHQELADVLDPVYSALEIPFERDAVGSVARAGGPGDPEPVMTALEGALATEPTIRHVRET
ncbi:MAG: lipoate-protein ligase A [halophilic archaeon J07HX64]|jgi:Lipoate-protein ligase A|nr:MAG: lipoate-protein ligase A [halophilic archaeon J07HX64]